ncbi:MAG: hypothetical protein ABSD42_14645 [Candidatus Bathyarchaeia archaeon]|jgi:hypothetical protein
MTTVINDSIINEFLNSQKEGTRTTYKTQIKSYLEYTKKSGQQLLDDKKAVGESKL